MRFSHWIILAAVALLLGASIIVGQLVYRVDRTVLSYRYMTDAIPDLVAPLSDDDVHAETVRSLAGLVRREAGLGMPPQMVRMFDEAALFAFDPSWFEWTLTRNMYSIIGVLRGSRAELSLPVNISGFESAFMNEVRGNLPPEMVQQVSAEVAGLPGAFDLATAIPEETRASIVGFGRRYGLLSSVVMYVLPALLTIGCFAFRRVGAALLGGGVGYLLGGVSVLALRPTIGSATAGALLRATRGAFPRGLGWLPTELSALARDIAAGLWQYALLIAVIGLVATALGTWLVATGRNELLDFTSISVTDEE